MTKIQLLKKLMDPENISDFFSLVLLNTLARLPFCQLFLHTTPTQCRKALSPLPNSTSTYRFSKVMLIFFEKMCALLQNRQKGHGLADILLKKAVEGCPPMDFPRDYRDDETVFAQEIFHCLHLEISQLEKDKALKFGGIPNTCQPPYHYECLIEIFSFFSVSIAGTDDRGGIVVRLEIKKHFKTDNLVEIIRLACLIGTLLKWGKEGYMMDHIDSSSLSFFIPIENVPEQDHSDKTLGYLEEHPEIEKSYYDSLVPLVKKAFRERGLEHLLEPIKEETK